MTKRMLIDATHKEETRVAIVDNNKLEDFDYETTIRKQLKGNIYLVKVTRVEPSLQAAFVDYGGNRHGFLPFPEIHPDYYKIPIEDRQALLEEERAIAKERLAEAEAKADAEAEAEEKKRLEKAKKSGNKENSTDEDTEETRDKSVDIIGGEDDEIEENSVRPAQMKRNIKRRYKIQEVIKRGQVMLIQINKEERGNKGAAVSSYLSLPGRYCVLMPNSSRGGGVSRKVSNIQDRKRLKKILQEIGVPEGMSVILRTAGVARTKVEIKRDLDYLLRLWNEVRELTMKSTAPAMVHEEGNLIKRSIRDLYKKEIEEIIIDGEDGYQTAKKFMKTLIPSHARRVKLDKEDAPLFGRYQVERQIDETYNPNVRLKSGGYLVINPTEALISIDINSGKATTGRHIEETALKTNMEAAEEIARQLRLRDLGGLVVIDFIDMEEPKNNRAVERKMRESMQGDRARIQVSKISVFGLLELSRQRLRPSLVESNFMTCSSCAGEGIVRTVESAAVMVLRHIEENLLKDDVKELFVKVSADVALYLLNKKRNKLHDLEANYKAKVIIEVDISASNQDFILEVMNASGARIKLYSSIEELDIDKNHASAQAKGNKNNNRSKNNNNRNQKRRNNRNKRQNNNSDNNSPDNNEAVKPDNKNQQPVVKANEVKNIPIKDASSENKDVVEKTETETKKKPVRRGRKPANKKKDITDEKVVSEKTIAPKVVADKTDKKKVIKKPVAKEKPAAKVDNKVVVLDVSEKTIVKDEPPKKKKKGWWQKLKD